MSARLLFAPVLALSLLLSVVLLAACGGSGDAGDGRADARADAAPPPDAGAETTPPADVPPGDAPDAGPCVPSCEERTCGPDGCGGRCGTCGDGTVCLDGACCEPSCAGRDCGPDGCGGSCGRCLATAVCIDGACCRPECAGRDCGPDGCGGSCGACAEGVPCLDGVCCERSCAGRVCGPDGCGGTCGRCEAGRSCVEGACLLPDADGDGVPDVADPFPLDGTRPGEARADVVYAHTATTLYLMDVKTYQLTRSATFTGLAGDNEFERRMTDIAIDAYGVLWGVSYLRLYTCHPETGACTLMVDLEPVVDEDIYEFNALTMVPGQLFDEPRDVLVGVSNDGGWHRFDVDYDERVVEITRLGEYGRERRSSGDAYSILGIGTFAAVDRAGTDDFLVAVDPLTGASAPDPVANLPGYGQIFGLAGWTQHAFAFDRSGVILVVDVSSGDVAATLQHRQSGEDVALCRLNSQNVGVGDPVCTGGAAIEWWGAGVRTRIED